MAAESAEDADGRRGSLHMRHKWGSLGLGRLPLNARAESALRDHNLNLFLKFGDGEAAAGLVEEPAPSMSDANSGAVLLLDDVLSNEQCADVRAAVDDAIARRGGSWYKDRHRKFPTTDLPLVEVPEVEALLREAMFLRIVRPLTGFYFGETFLPEHLELRDAFFVKYSAAEGEQRSLEVHTDGSVFSFNLLLSDPSEFDGGGTFFEAANATVRASQGGAVVHAGDVRHGGLAITRGERYLLVGFVSVDPGLAQSPYCVAHSTWAASDAFSKFGHGAFDRSPLSRNSAAEANRVRLPGDCTGKPGAVAC